MHLPSAANGRDSVLRCQHACLFGVARAEGTKVRESKLYLCPVKHQRRDAIKQHHTRPSCIGIDLVAVFNT